MHLDRAITLYDPAAHRPLAALFGQDNPSMAALNLSVVGSVDFLGYPDAALVMPKHALKHAREIGQAGTSDVCADPYPVVDSPIFARKVCCSELPTPMKLSRWRRRKVPCSGKKTLGTVPRGCVLALTGKASGRGSK